MILRPTVSLNRLRKNAVHTRNIEPHFQIRLFQLAGSMRDIDKQFASRRSQTCTTENEVEARLEYNSSYEDRRRAASTPAAETEALH
jgi:hypothetical protein